jgi:hypothetical protein
LKLVIVGLTRRCNDDGRTANRVATKLHQHTHKPLTLVVRTVPNKSSNLSTPQCLNARQVRWSVQYLHCHHRWAKVARVVILEYEFRVLVLGSNVLVLVLDSWVLVLVLRPWVCKHSLSTSHELLTALLVCFFNVLLNFQTTTDLFKSMVQCNLILFYIAQCYVSSTSWQFFVFWTCTRKLGTWNKSVYQVIMWIDRLFIFVNFNQLLTSRFNYFTPLDRQA